MNCEFAGYADHILKEKGVTCTPTYWSERDDWTLAMVAAGLGFAFMPENAVKHPGVVAFRSLNRNFGAVLIWSRSEAALLAWRRCVGARSHAEEMVWS